MEALRQLTTLAAASGMKHRPQQFTRGGPLAPDLLISLLLYLVSAGRGFGYRHVLNAFWEDAARSGLELPTDDPVSGAAFCKARRKLKPQAVLSLLREVADSFDREHGDAFRFHGRRVLAVDAAKVNTTRSDALWREFEGPRKSFTPQAMVTTLYDVFAKIPISATVTGCRGNEREELLVLLDAVRPGDILVLDRGYPSFEIINLLLQRHIDFVIRVPSKGTFQAVHQFIQSGRKDSPITLTGKRSRAGMDFCQARAVRREGPDGSPQVYLTSLKRPEFSTDMVIELYRKRWEVETFYALTQAGALDQRQYRAKTPDGVRQEIYAVLLYAALTRTLMATAAHEAEVPYEEISMKGAVLAVAGCLTRLLLVQDEEDAKPLLERLLQQMVRARDRKRLGRSFPRVSHKPQPRWNPRGRAGAASVG